MKSIAVVTLACMLASASAFTAPTMATRAVGNPFARNKAAAKTEPVAKKAPAKKAAAAPKKAAAAPKKAAPAPKKAAAAAPVARAAPPASKGYPSIADAASKIRFNISGGGNNAPPSPYKVPNFADPRLQIERDPAFYKEAAKSRKTAFSRNQEYVYEDGLTELERRQRATIPGFLTGSAKSQADPSAIRDDVEVDTLIFGLDTDRFQLLFLSVFGLFTLVGCLSGNLNF
eukprot:CAMPEP_0176505186 /NCGR_PEP_ID=MMETSP0200_2-20121128/16354_1 /TAXON_ID=947934 /ORGANISM="Chaetoceros sp., Strain GSL56" /LENGTH=229 /DNA_ID=CAMNT_0017904711 /DNA_START=370 /DNA_END=1059 /DNA_ORIENTATION=+